MSRNSSSAPNSESRTAERRTYSAPSLVRYGSLFVSTGKADTDGNCSIGNSGSQDGGTDPCDPDKHPNGDGDKK
jgi:hypothetical protein